MGLDDDGHAEFSDLSKLELFQILSPVRKHLHGVQELNRWVQRRFRKHELDEASRPFGLSLGDEHIVLRDRVIQLKSERAAYDWEQRESTSIWLANGETGLAAQRKGKWPNFLFARCPNKTIGYRSGDFAASTAPLELAHASRFTRRRAASSLLCFSY